MAEQKKGDPAGTAAVNKKVDVVSQDRNWVLRINGELDSEKKWDGQWGFLSKGIH